MAMTSLIEHDTLFPKIKKNEIKIKRENQRKGQEMRTVKFVTSYLIYRIKSIFVKARRYLDELTKNTIRWHKKLLMEIGGDR